MGTRSSQELEKAFIGISTPAYIFDAAAFAERAHMVREALADNISLCYSIKANPFLLSVLPNDIDRLEVCSPGELNICKALAIDPEVIIYSGVNKSAADISDAIDYGVTVITAESPVQMRHIDAAARNANVHISVLLRLACRSQFGMDEMTIRGIVNDRRSYENINITGIHYFTGTQKSRPAMIIEELSYLEKYLDELTFDTGWQAERVEYGTGLACEYFSDDADETERQLLSEIANAINTFDDKYDLTIEMGRFFAAPCGYYVSEIADVKTTNDINYAIIDGGLHQVHYDGQMHGMYVPVITHITAGAGSDINNEVYRKGDAGKWTICGSLCTTSDVLVRGVDLPNMNVGDKLVFHRTGAYSLYEGTSLFLSRDLPSIYMLNNDRELIETRPRIETAEFNTPAVHTGTNDRRQSVTWH